MWSVSGVLDWSVSAIQLVNGRSMERQTPSHRAEGRAALENNPIDWHRQCFTAVVGVKIDFRTHCVSGILTVILKNVWGSKEPNH